MEEAEYLADRVAIVRRGKIVALGAPSELVSRDNVTLVRFRPPADAPDLVAGIEGAISSEDGLLTIETSSPTGVLYELTRRAHDRGLELPELTVTRPSLEDTYLELVEESAQA